MIGRAASLIAITQRERQEIIERFALVPERVVVVPNGVSEPRMFPSKDDRLPKGRYILFLGRLHEVKGPDLLLEAFAAIAPSVPDVELVFIGPDFGMRRTLEARSQNLGLTERVRFLGYADEILRFNAYHGSALVVVPSRSEAMSLVALEAGAVGKPVLLTDRCGFDDVGRFGGLVVPASVDGLARGLRDLLEPGSNLTCRGRMFCNFVLENYGWPKVAECLRLHLGRLCGADSSSADPRAV